MYHITSIFTTLLLLINFIIEDTGAAETAITVTTPVNPVEQGAIFAFHCQVWNLKDGQEVTLIRKHDKTRIFLNDVLQLTDERMYLAQRQMSDGSTVYFLSIMAVSRQDEGKYTCKIIDTDGTPNLPSDTITLQTLYFPPDSDPQCSRMPNTPVYAGTYMSMNCTSHVGNPPVTLQWINSKTQEPYTKTRKYANKDIVSVVLDFKVTQQHSGIIFMCQMTSASFPGKKPSCHTGPFEVLPNPDGSLHPTVTPPISHQDVTNTDIISITMNTFNQKDCKQKCSVLKSPTLFWIIATVATIIMALIFFILVVTLFLKYRKMPVTRKYCAPAAPVGKVYDEIQRRQIDDRVYMSLVKLKRTNEDEALAANRNTMGRYDAP